MEKPRLLIADDECDLREFIGALLTDAGFAVTMVSDGRKAQEALARETFDAVVLDLQMPRMDGFEVLRWAREQRGLEQLGVLILSGDDQRASVERGLGLGADDYLLKPFSAWELEARLKGLVHRIQVRRDV